jgi:hypothetical protein
MVAPAGRAGNPDGNSILCEEERTVKKESRKRAMTGTLIRGADGALYFVEDNKTLAFRLQDEFTTEARALLDREGFVANPKELPAFHGSGLVRKVRTIDGEIIAVVLDRLAAFGRRKPHEK